MRLLIFCVFFSNYSLSATQGNVKLPEQGKTLRKREKREKEGGLGRAMARIREKTGGWRREGGFWRWKSREDRGWMGEGKWIREDTWLWPHQNSGCHANSALLPLFLSHTYTHSSGCLFYLQTPTLSDSVWSNAIVGYLEKCFANIKNLSQRSQIYRNKNDFCTCTFTQMH